jgi:glucokinase
MKTEIEDRFVEESSQSMNAPEYVAGVDAGGTNLRLALADLSGTILKRWSASVVGLRGHDAVIERICGGIRTMLQEVSAAPGALRSIAIGVPGIVDFDNGVVIATSYLMGWRDVPLRELTQRELNVPVVIDNDVNMAAIGEQWAGSAKDAKDFVFLAIGTGIGAGIILNGNLHRGSSWGAGEVGYMLLPGASQLPTSRDEPGALESMVGGEGIKAQWTEIRTADENVCNATEIFDLALEGNPQARTLLQQSATLLAQAIYNISLILNCPLFVLGGTVGLHPALAEATREVLDRWLVPGNPTLVASVLGTDAQLMGTIRVALDSVRICPGATGR